MFRAPVRLLLKKKYFSRAAEPLVLSLDVMDVSGEVQHDVSHTITKTRRSAEGAVLSEEVIQRESSVLCVQTNK